MRRRRDPRRRFERAKDTEPRQIRAPRGPAVYWPACYWRRRSRPSAGGRWPRSASPAVLGPPRAPTRWARPRPGHALRRWRSSSPLLLERPAPGGLALVRPGRLEAVYFAPGWAPLLAVVYGCGLRRCWPYRAVGRRRSAARPDAVRRVPVGPARVHPDRRAAAAAGRARRRPAGHLRGRAGRCPAGRRRPRPWPVGRRPLARAGLAAAAGRRLAVVAGGLPAARAGWPTGRRPVRSPRPGQRARGPGWTSTPSAGRAGQPRGPTSRWPPTSRPGTRRGRIWCIWPENASRHRPVPARPTPAGDRRAVRAIGVPDPGRRGARRAGAATSRNAGIVWEPGDRAGAALRQAAPGAVRRVHPVPRASPAVHAKVDLVRRTSSPGTGAGRAAASGRLEVGDVDLLRGGLRRPGARRGRRRRGCWSCRPTTPRSATPPRPAAAGDVPAARGRARPDGAARRRRAGISAVIAPDGTVVAQAGLFTPAVLEADDPAAHPADPRHPRRGRPEWRWLRSGCSGRAALSGPRAAAAAPATGRHPAIPTDRAGTRRGTDRARGRHGERVPRDPARVLVIIPTYNERENLAADRRAGPRRGARRATCWSPTTTAPTAPARSPTGCRRRRPRPRAAPPRQAGPGRGVPGRLPLGHGARVRRPGGDGRRRLAPAGGAAPAAGRARGRRPGDRLPLGARRARWSTGRWHRELLSRGGNTYARLALGMPVRDVTGGYRAFRRSALQELGLDDVASQGYCFQVDLTWRAVRRGLRVVEVPITFVEREPAPAR